MMVLQKSPDFSQGRQVLYLDLGEFVQHDAGTAIKLLVELKNGLRLFELRRLPDWLAIHQQLQIVRPGLSSPDDKNAEEELHGFLMERQLDGVFRPIRGPLQLAFLHVVKS